MAISRGVERSDRRDAVAHPAIVKQDRIKRFRQREAASNIADAVIDLGGSASHIFAFHQDDANPVDTISMHAFGRRQTSGSFERFNMELVYLNMPRRAAHRITHLVEYVLASAEKVQQDRICCDLWENRFKPSFDIAV